MTNTLLKERTVDAIKASEKTYDSYILEDPRAIYEFLKSKVYGQDKALKNASMFLYNHVHNRPQRAIFAGPTGCGKSEIFRAMKEIYPYIIIANAASVSRTGLIGDSPSSCLYDVIYGSKQYIICFDEFDKLCESSICQEENVQSEYLALIQPSHPYIRLQGSRNESERRLKIDKYSWAIIGSFSTASKYAETCSSNDNKELTIDDLIKYGGLMSELAGRMSRLVNLNALSSDDYMRLITDFDNGPLNTMERMYGFKKGYVRKNIINRNCIKKISDEAFESGLGVRYTYGKIQELIDSYVFDSFEQYKNVTNDELNPFVEQSN